MNGSVARKLRKLAFGDLSRRYRDYGVIPHIRTVFRLNKQGQETEKKLRSGQLVCRGPREDYQNLKKAYYRGELRQAIADLRRAKEIREAAQADG